MTHQPTLSSFLVREGQLGRNKLGTTQPGATGCLLLPASFLGRGTLGQSHRPTAGHGIKGRPHADHALNSHRHLPRRSQKVRLRTKTAPLRQTSKLGVGENPTCSVILEILKLRPDAPEARGKLRCFGDSTSGMYFPGRAQTEYR